MSKKKYRVLVDQDINGIDCKANDVVLLEEKTGDSYDTLDGEAEAVKYCTNELGVKVKDLAALYKAAKADDTDEDGEGSK